MQTSWHNASQEPWYLSNAEWRAYSRILVSSPPSRKRGRPRRTDDRLAAQACLYRHFHSHGKNRTFGWNRLPKRLGVSPATANRRFREWTESGAWLGFYEALIEHRFENAFLFLQKHGGRNRPDSPVVAVIRELERGYAFFNACFCGGKLPGNVIITIEKGFPRHRRGEFRPIRIRRRRRYWLAVACEELERPPEQIMGVLLHEMVHLRNHLAKLPDAHQHYHNCHFRDTAALLGLQCEKRHPRRGYMTTSLNEWGCRAVALLKPDIRIQ